MSPRPTKLTFARLEAKSRGETFFSFDQPCKYGHMTLRRVINNQCIECERIFGRINDKKRVRDKSERNKASRKYYAGHKDIHHARVVAVRAQRLGAEGFYTYDDVRSLLKGQDKKCKLCKTSIDRYFEVDHIVVLADGGSNYPNNIQLLCRQCNRTKSYSHGKNVLPNSKEILDSLEIS